MLDLVHDGSIGVGDVDEEAAKGGDDVEPASQPAARRPERVKEDPDGDAAAGDPESARERAEDLRETLVESDLVLFRRRLRSLHNKYLGL